ncbi:hypothetical protein Scep_007789 [Stephania cephalantha]|uniref:Uncharacterized protein n=1 Tax=Stephania cephalantha TaxID=152367 RepID=A0AAP0PM42_9MAGN
MEGKWSSVIAASEEDGDESRPPLEKGASGIIAAAATHGGASTGRPHERKHEEGAAHCRPPRSHREVGPNDGPSTSAIDLGKGKAIA